MSAEATTDLAAFLAVAPDGAPAEDAPEEERTRYRIGGDREAEWALRKKAQALTEIERVTTLAAEERARIDAWVKQASAEPERDVAYFDGLLREYHEGLLAEELAKLEAEGKPPGEAWERAKRKTYKLPAGDLVARKGGSGIVVGDALAFEMWVRHDPDNLGLAEVKPSKSAIKANAVRREDDDHLFLRPDDPEPIPGVSWYQDPPSFTAKPAPLPGQS